MGRELPHMATESHTESLTILLVDDNDDLREVTVELLESLGHRVLPATRAETALRIFERREDEWEDEIDLLITEAIFPGMDGIDLADRLRGRKPSLAVLLISTHDNHGDLRQRVARGESVFLLKPYGLEELTAKIAQARSWSEGRWQEGPSGSPDDLAQGASEAPPEPTPNRRGSRLHILWRSAAAGAAIFGLAAIFNLVSQRPPGLPEQVSENSTTRLATVLPVYPMGEIASLPNELRWEPVTGAHRYRVRLLGVDDEVVWEGTTQDQVSIGLPERVQARLHPHVVYYWTVDALDHRGARLSGSERAGFRVDAGPGA